MGGIAPAVKAALTRAYKEGSKSRMVRAADLITLPGIKKAPKKRIVAILEPSSGDGTGENNEESAVEVSEEENASDTEDLGPADGETLQKELQSLNKKGVQVQLDLKESGNLSAKKAQAGRDKGGTVYGEKNSNARGSGSAVKRK